mmetsp:Transcript_20605/g.37227  ORF Transcript_20605/g.37227 Transcript_20605/m.37227 type:complete len:420 (+) Transcript_20605:94-1353(+)
MRSSTPSCICYLSLLLLALLPPTTVSAKRRRSTTRRRQRQPTPPSRATKLSESNSEETLRERWVDILSLEQDSNSVRLENQQEEQYYYEAEILADKLLGLDDSDGSTSLQKDSLKIDSLLLKELSMLWKSIAIASSVILIGIPIAALFGSIITSTMMQQMLASIQSSITPYLIPTLSLISTSIRNSLLQVQAIVHSMPYILRHLNHIKISPLPFLYKLIRKCIILEAWRHVWVRVYKLTRYMWVGTLNNAKSAYIRLVPSWIRRGVKSMFQSMVMAQVHGVVGGLGTALSGVTFESWAWSSSDDSSSSSSVLDSESLDSMQDSAVNDAMAESMTDSAAQSLETAIHDAMDSVSIDDTMDALTGSAGSAVDDAVEAMVGETMDALAESVEFSLEDVVLESFVDECLSEGCLDQVVESVLE